MEAKLTRNELKDAVIIIAKKLHKELSYTLMFNNGLDYYQIVNNIIIDMFIHGINSPDAETIIAEIKIKEYISGMNVEGFYSFKD